MRALYRQMHNLPSSAATPVRTTHLYVKLHPEDTTQFSMIVDDTVINAFPYPLDYELIGQGNYVQPTEDTGWVYAVVPVNWSPLSTINHLLIDSCCIPEKQDEDLIEIENAALVELFGPGELPVPTRVMGKPKGYIKVQNTSTGQYDGMRRIKVVMNTLVRVAVTYTNDNGYYEYNGWSFVTNVNYSIMFENIHDFKVWNHHNGFTSVLQDAMCLGKHSPQGYSYNILVSDFNWRAATICNAASVYYNHLWKGTDLNIGRPVGGLRIGYLPISGYIHSMTGHNWTACTPMWRHRIYSATEWYQYLAIYYVTLMGGLAIPDMMVWSDSWYTDTICSTIFHELAHVSHYRKVGNTYWDSLVANTISNSGYGDINNFPDYVGVAEMWAYYAEVNAYDFYKSHYDQLMPIHAGVPSGYWFRPDILQSLDNSIPDFEIHDIFECMTNTNTNHCTFRGEVLNRVPVSYHSVVVNAFNPLCPS